LETVWLALKENPVLAWAAAAGIAALAAWFAGRSGKRLLSQEKADLSRKLARAESHAKEQTRIVSRMRAEQGTVASLALVLPSVVRELNSHDLNLRRVPGIILQLVEAIFQPGQILFYQSVMTTSPRGNHRELRLIAHRGLGELPEALRRIAPGQGKIGWVAEHKVDMLREGWTNLKRTDGIVIEDNHPVMEADVMGPLVHSTVEGDQVLGVLCIGAPSIRPRDEKLMFQLVTHLGSLAMVTAQQKSKLADQANHDGLTGLLNKSYFMHELASLMLTTQREAQQLALFIFDIDHFKVYNDSNGHPAGDVLLRKLASLLKSIVRPGDWCCRYGGEEFMVAMPQTNGRDAMAVSERIRRAIEQEPFPLEASQPNGRVTISGGVAVIPKDAESIEELIERSDKALYQSKTAGRNRVTRYRHVAIGDLEDDYAPESALEAQSV
jgi:diguanylate cyclase (GGDEF)-like protein